MTRPGGGPRLSVLAVADPPETWQRLGFQVSSSRLELGGVQVVLGASGQGIVGWAVDGLEQVAEINGLALAAVARGTPQAAGSHPNGAIGIDHVVLVSPTFDGTVAALERAGIPLRRIAQSARGVRQGFRRLGGAILELVEAPDADRVYLWGLTVTVEDIDALAALLGDRLGSIKPAVQPGRRIATLSQSAGLSTPMAFMTRAPT